MRELLYKIQQIFHKPMDKCQTQGFKTELKLMSLQYLKEDKLKKKHNNNEDLALKYQKPFHRILNSR